MTAGASTANQTAAMDALRQGQIENIALITEREETPAGTPAGGGR